MKKNGGGEKNVLNMCALCGIGPRLEGIGEGESAPPTAQRWLGGILLIRRCATNDNPLGRRRRRRRRTSFYGVEKCLNTIRRMATAFDSRAGNAGESG
jgi:hypothetical protein